MKIAKYWKRAHFLAKHNIIGLVFISYFDDNDHFVCSAIKLFKFHAIDASRWFTNLTSLMQFVFQCSKEMSFLQVLKTLNPCENCNCVEWIFFFSCCVYLAHHVSAVCVLLWHWNAKTQIYSDKIFESTFMIKIMLCCLKNDIANIKIKPWIMASAMHYISSINSILIQKMRNIQEKINIYTRLYSKLNEL